MKQEYTSKDTSINSSKLPAIYKVLAKHDYIADCSILDYGCGRYTDHISAFAKENGATAWNGADKYNQSPAHNARVLARTYDVAVLSNVINVIKEDYIISEIVQDCLDHAPVCFITVYEGDKSGVGKATQGGKSWQRNQKKADYIAMLENMGFIANKWHGIIAVTFG